MYIALAVGTLLSVINQWEPLSSGHMERDTYLRIVANYVIPYVVSNLGAMASEPRDTTPRAR